MATFGGAACSDTFVTTVSGTVAQTTSYAEGARYHASRKYPLRCFPVVAFTHNIRRKGSNLKFHIKAWFSNSSSNYGHHDVVYKSNRGETRPLGGVGGTSRGLAVQIQYELSLDIIRYDTLWLLRWWVFFKWFSGDRNTDSTATKVRTSWTRSICYWNRQDENSTKKPVFVHFNIWIMTGLWQEQNDHRKATFSTPDGIQRVCSFWKWIKVSTKNKAQLSSFVWAIESSSTQSCC